MKPYDEMTNTELDSWCEETSGTIIYHNDSESIMVLMKSMAPSKRPPGSRKYNMRLVNLSYLTIGSAPEEVLFNIINGTDDRYSIHSKMHTIDQKDVNNYGQKESDADLSFLREDLDDD